MSLQTKTPLALCSQKDSQAGSQARGTGTSHVSIISREGIKAYGMKPACGFYAREILDELKSHMPDVLAHYGIDDLRRNFNCPSPDHEDANPSAHFNPKRNTVHCFGCDRTWDAFSFVGMIEGIAGFSDQVKRTAEIVDFRLDEPSMIPLPRKQVARQPRFEAPQSTGFGEQQIEPFLGYMEALLENETALAYLHGRGFDNEMIIKSILGFVKDPKTVSDRFTLFEPNETQGYIVIPFSSGDVIPTVSYVMLRAIPADTPPAHKEIRPTGIKSPLYREWLIGKGCEVLYVAEGLLDCIALEALLGKPCIGLGGTGGVKRLSSLLFYAPEEQRPKKVVLALDDDAAGAKAARKLCNDIRSMGIPCSVMQMPEGCKDPNDMLIAVRRA